MSFGVVNGVGRWMGVLGRGGDRQKEKAVWGLNVGHPIATNGEFLHSCAKVREPINWDGEWGRLRQWCIRWRST